MGEEGVVPRQRQARLEPRPQPLPLGREGGIATELRLTPPPPPQKVETAAEKLARLRAKQQARARRLPWHWRRRHTHTRRPSARRRPDCSGGALAVTTLAAQAATRPRASSGTSNSCVTTAAERPHRGEALAPPTLRVARKTSATSTVTWSASHHLWVPAVLVCAPFLVLARRSLRGGDPRGRELACAGCCGPGRACAPRDTALYQLW